MIFGVEGVEPERRERLIDLLDIDLDWRLNKVSDGQRRRVQICMGLLKPYKASACLTMSASLVYLYPGQRLHTAWPCSSLDRQCSPFLLLPQRTGV